jgi:hypothetical protein
LGSNRKSGLNLEKAVEQSKFTPLSPIKATPSGFASNSNIVSNQKIDSNPDIACPVTLSNPAFLCNPVILSNPLTLSYPATFSDPLTLSKADDVMLMSPSQSKDVHDNNSTPTASYPPVNLPKKSTYVQKPTYASLANLAKENLNLHMEGF